MTHSIVFGGSKGLGRVVARQLSSRGDQVSVISRTEPPTADQSAAIDHFQADITDEAATRRALDAAMSRHGPLSYLVFCQRYRGKSDAWSGEIDVSLTASKRVVEYLEEHFLKDLDAGIVFVSSVFGDKVGEGQSLSYHIGKAGMNHMTRYYAVNLGRKGIRTNSVAPFTFLKEESRDFYLGNEELLDMYAEIVPLGRMGTAEDCANVITFLCSAAAGFVNGQNIGVDGGLSLVWPETLARKLKSL